ncbi:MAG: polysaccharide biosynthesis protein [Clostridia bacterium]|nr:polysaccharide biosynthesis protein [Clostridia bacterium]MBQ9714765.1 polysaccharide biosynthesis protein [Clostridia bacterium]
MEKSIHKEKSYADKRPVYQKNDKNGFLKGAVWIAAGGFIAKLLGALYRIPLTNLIGGYGMGLYQMVYPVYCLLLTVSATGIPSSIAKLTAERIGIGQSGLPVFKTAMKLFLCIGLLGTAIMCVIAPFLATAQGSKEVLGGYYALAPSVFLVSAISVFRGFFQGKNNMKPTAFSEITEQAVKVGVGLIFAYLFRANVRRAVTFLLLAVSISETTALLLMLFLFRRDPSPVLLQKNEEKISAKAVLKLSIPVTFSSIILPLSGLLDSVLVPRFLGAYAENAVTLFGLFSGGAVTVINLPVSICYGIAAASVPAVATAAARKKNGASPRKRVVYALAVTVAVALPSAAALFFFAAPAAKIIFRALADAELDTLIKLIRIFSVSALTLSCVQTLSACLTAQGKPQYAALSMLLAVMVKTGLYTWWLQSSKISIFGLAHATNICYLVAFLINLVYNLIVSKQRRKE